MKKVRKLFNFYISLMSLRASYLSFLILSGCAYNFRGFVARDVSSIAIPVFENQTVKYGIEEQLTKLVIDAFIKDNQLKVLDRKSADSILLGEIIKYNRAPFSYDDQANVKDYKIELNVKLTYKKSLNDKVILEKELKDWSLYSSQKTEEEGIEELCEKIADDILKGIMEGW